MMVPIQVIRWYRMQCYDGTDSCATVVPIRRYCHHLELGVTQKSYGNYIRKKINDGNVDYEVEGFVEDFAKSHNI